MPEKSRGSMAGAPWAEATSRGLHEGFFLKGSTLLSSVELEGNEILLPLRYKTSHDATDASHSQVYGSLQKPSCDGLFKHS